MVGRFTTGSGSGGSFVGKCGAMVNGVNRELTEILFFGANLNRLHYNRLSPLVSPKFFF